MQSKTTQAVDGYGNVTQVVKYNYGNLTSEGKAIRYLLKHWEKLTLFLRQPGAPLDSNIVERALKKAILNRKNALFYKTRNGARVGDLYMSLIHSCELSGGNPFDYLTELQRHAAEIERSNGIRRRGCRRTIV